MNTVTLRRKRKRLFKEQKGLCYYCKGPMIYIELYPGRPIKNMVTIEHLIIPVLGQKKNGAKLVATCADCNQKKATEYEKKYIDLHRARSQNGRKKNFRNRPLLKLKELRL